VNSHEMADIRSKKGKKRKLGAMAVDSDIVSPETQKRKLDANCDQKKFIDSEDSDSPNEDEQGAIPKAKKDDAAKCEPQRKQQTVKLAASAAPRISVGGKLPTAGKITGVIVSWIHHKGIGFIKRDDTGSDVFCHRNDVRNGGVGAMLGSRVEFIVKTSDRGERASEVTAIGGGCCPSGRQARGTVTRWTVRRGPRGKDPVSSGFIKGDDGRVVFVEGRHVWEYGGVLNEGDRVEYDVVDSGSQLEAWYVTDEGRPCRQCNICKKKGHSDNSPHCRGKMG